MDGLIELVVVRRAINKGMLLAEIPGRPEAGQQKIRVRNQKVFCTGDRLLCRQVGPEVWELEGPEPKSRRCLLQQKEREASDEQKEREASDEQKEREASDGCKHEGDTADCSSNGTATSRDTGNAGKPSEKEPSGGAKNPGWEFLRRVGRRTPQKVAAGVSGATDEVLQGSSEEERRTHNAEVAGSSPAPATMPQAARE